MRLKQYLIESKNKPLIVVDVQPAYKSYLSFDPEEFMEFINERTGKILMLVNADQEGLTEDTINDCWNWWWENGLMREKDDRSITVFDKGFGYIRSWMDQSHVDKSNIKKVIRYMYQKRITDSRDIPLSDFLELLGDDWEDWMEDEPLSTEWISVKLLKEHSGGYICGGGRKECLKEVQLMMSAFNLRAREIKKFIY